MGLSATQPGPHSQSSPKPHHRAIGACSHARPFPLFPSFKRTGLGRAECKVMTARTFLHSSCSQSHEPGVCKGSHSFLSQPKSEIFHSNCSWFIFHSMRNHPSLARARGSRRSHGCCACFRPSLPPSVALQDCPMLLDNSPIAKALHVGGSNPQPLWKLVGAGLLGTKWTSAGQNHAWREAQAVLQDMTWKGAHCWCAMAFTFSL